MDNAYDDLELRELEQLRDVLLDGNDLMYEHYHHTNLPQICFRDMLLYFERLVAKDRLERHEASREKWTSSVTKYSLKHFAKSLKDAEGYQLVANSDVTCIIKVTLLGDGMKEYSVNLSEFYCSCQYFLEHNLPCIHMAFAIWKTQTCRRLYWRRLD